MFLLNSNIPANTSEDMMVDSDTGEVPQRYINGPARITYALEADAVGIEYEIIVGGVVYVERSTCDAGGTLGVAPNLDAKATGFDCNGGTLQVKVFEIAGTATTDLMLTLEIDQ